MSSLTRARRGRAYDVREMVPLPGTPWIAARVAVGLAILAMLALLGGCGSSGSGGSKRVVVADTHKSCPATVVEALSHVVRRVYREGIASERTAVAQATIAASVPLREAVQRGDAAAAAAAARALVAEGRMTNLRVLAPPGPQAGGRVLADVGGDAITPLSGTLLGASGAPIGTYVTSVWSDSGFLAESDSIASGKVALRVAGRSVGGSLALPARRLPPEGSIVLGHTRYQFASFGGRAFPDGRPLRVYLLRAIASTTALCGSSSEDTTVNALSYVARLIYAGEGGTRAQRQVRRVQGNAPLLQAVARRDPLATRVAVEQLLNQHIVRLRVNAPPGAQAGGRLLADVGGPYVLAPVSAPLRLGGRTIGSFVLSIQDDEGYLRLTRRLAGLRVLMYMNATNPVLVKNSLGPEPGSVPDSGRYEYRGSTYRVFTLHANAFPSGPLTVRVLIPVPYP